MATPIAQLKQLFTEFLTHGGDFSKLPEEFKKPILVKVFRAEPFLYIQDKENYVVGYLSTKAKNKLTKEYKLLERDLKAQTLKVEKFTLELCHVPQGEYNPVSYMDREIRFIIKEFSLSRPLKRGVDVNKFVVNICRDEEFMLAIAKSVHFEQSKAEECLSLEEFVKNEVKLATRSAYPTFSSVYYGDSPTPKPKEGKQKKVDYRFQLGELVTCIVDDRYDPKENSKGKKRRSLKNEVKEEAVNEAKDEIKELESEVSDIENQPTTVQKPRTTRKTRKALEPKQIDYKTEEKEVPLTNVKMENEFKTEIEKILQYSKKSKSKPDMDFLNSTENQEAKMPEIKPPSPKRTKKMTKFREYMEWYDRKYVQGKSSVASKGGSTALSTPLKVSLRISERIANAKRMR